MLDTTQPRSLRACSRDDPECGARRGVLRQAARNRSPREAGTPPSRHYDLGARSSLHGSARHLPAVVGRRAPKETEARPREPKIATVERREASVPRHGKRTLHKTPDDSIEVRIIHAVSSFYNIVLYCAPWCSTPIFRTPAGHWSPGSFAQA